MIFLVAFPAKIEDSLLYILNINVIVEIGTWTSSLSRVFFFCFLNHVFSTQVTYQHNISLQSNKRHHLHHNQSIYRFVHHLSTTQNQQHKQKKKPRKPRGERGKYCTLSRIRISLKMSCGIQRSLISFSVCICFTATF